MNWKFENIYFNGSWQRDLFIQTDLGGIITQATAFHQQDVDHQVSGYVVPGLVNSHSHAFQYAMAGLSENLPMNSVSDDFWSWRTRMYNLALQISPEQMQQVATLLYSQMLVAGYTWVSEFHYLHHDSNGESYSQMSEMSARLVRAAADVGIGITLIPIFYQKGGFDAPSTKEQCRFISPSFDDYMKLYRSCEKTVSGTRSRIGAGIHSLRAVDTQSVINFSNEFTDSGVPIHIHVSEQTAEVEQCIQKLGMRPVQWLTENTSIGRSWNLVHATHINDAEIKSLCETNANVVICPTTEANLGDGIFPLSQYIQHGGRFCIGSDSHIRVDLCEELRWLDYVQRLSERKRNVVCTKPGEDSGKTIFDHCLTNGADSAGIDQNLTVGSFLDAIVIDADKPLWQDLDEKRRLSNFVYCSGTSDFSAVIAAGKFVVENGRHLNTPEISLSEIRRSLT